MKIIDREQLEIFVKGALNQCIDAHGSIHFGWVPSAAKRILGRLVPEIEKYVQESRSQIIDNLRKEIQQLQTENRLLKDRVNKKRIWEHKKPNNLNAGLNEFFK